MVVTGVFNRLGLALALDATVMLVYSDSNEPYLGWRSSVNWSGVIICSAVYRVAISVVQSSVVQSSVVRSIVVRSMSNCNYRLWQLCLKSYWFERLF